MYYPSIQGQAFPKAFQDYFDLVYDKKRDLFLFGKEKSDVVERAPGLCGYFVIVTSERMSAKEALDLYKARDQSEKLFKGDKSYLGDKSAGIYSDESVSGKIFIEFVALIIRNRMYCQLKDGMEEYVAKPNYITVPAAIKELEKVEMIRQMDGIYRLDHAVTTRQKNVLKSKARHEATIAKVLFDAFKKSGKSYDAVMRFLKEGLR